MFNLCAHCYVSSKIVNFNSVTFYCLEYSEDTNYIPQLPLSPSAYHLTLRFYLSPGSFNYYKIHFAGIFHVSMFSVIIKTLVFSSELKMILKS